MGVYGRGKEPTGVSLIIHVLLLGAPPHVIFLAKTNQAALNWSNWCQMGVTHMCDVFNIAQVLC